MALWIEAGTRRVLLGADLEHTGKAGEGWLAVLGAHSDAVRAKVFKVPHHGSPNADCPEIWVKMLSDEPVAFVTPFNAGNVRLPAEADLTRLGMRTPFLYCTARGAGHPPPRDAAVEKTMRQFVRNRRVLDGQPGHVRVRWSVINETKPTIEVFNGAYKAA